jgi:hypothetical protein
MPIMSEAPTISAARITPEVMRLAIFMSLSPGAGLDSVREWVHSPSMWMVYGWQEDGARD